MTTMAGKVMAGVGLAVVMAGSGHATDAVGGAPAHPTVHHAAHHHSTTAAIPSARLPVPDTGSPVAFTANGGRLDGTVRYLAEGSTYHLYVTDADAVLALRTPKGSSSMRIGVLHLRPLGAAPARTVTDPDSRHVVTRGVWPGIDWAWRGSSSTATYELTLAKGADVNAARFEVADARSVQVDRGGDLLIDTPRGVLSLPAPIAWQTGANGRRRAVRVGYLALGGTRFGFQLGAHDADRPVVIAASTAG